MISSQHLITNDVIMKVRMMMMIEYMFKVSNDEELKNVKCHYNTH